MESLLNRISALESALEGLGTKERGALDLLYPTQTVTAAGGAASIVFPTAGMLPTNFKNLHFVGPLRGTKNAATDTLNVTVNAVAAGYYCECIYGGGVAAASTERLNAASWLTNPGLCALTAPAGLFSQFELTIYNYATSYNTLMAWKYGVYSSLLTGNIFTVSGHGFINSAQTVTSVTFAYTGGNIAQNSYLSCYGMSG